MNGPRAWATTAALALGMLGGAAVEAVEVLGTGTGALVGNDLTDFRDDGVELNYNPPVDLGGFDATFFSSDESAFGGGEFAFNVFDNVVGGGNDKWCCGTVFPQIVGADFGDVQYQLTHFTVSSANDAAERDPRVWRIEGSNDGADWTTIFSQEDLETALGELGLFPGDSIWTERLQVIRFEEGVDYEEQTTGYSMFRMVTEETAMVGGAFFQLGEIEFFDTAAQAPTRGAVLGVGTDALIGNDLTDLRNNGVEANYNPPGSLGGFDATFFSSDEPGFGGGEFAFNVFDNVLEGDNKWCCGTAFPQIVGADFGATTYRLTKFTVSSAGDAPERDPRVWRIDGSNDGVAWTTIFSQNNPAASLWTERFQVIRFDHVIDYDEQTEAYSKFRMVTDATGSTVGAFFQLAEIELFDEDVQVLARGEILGVGTEFLLGDDLTDIGNDGLEEFYLPPDDLGGFDATFFASDEEGFGGGEFAFNVFDNVVGGGNDKWCCGTVFPQIVGATFEDTYRLTHFTVSSANDAPERDPRIWHIEGSNDGECWTRIFSYTDRAAPLWTERLQVVLFSEGLDYDEQTIGYSMFRMVTDATGLIGGPFFQIGEIEFFGEPAAPPVGPVVCPPGRVLGTGAAALIGNDLTDFRNDGVEANYNPPADLGKFDATFFSNDEPGFEGGEFSFNVFDNLLGGGNDKWCCGTALPEIVGADFGDVQHRLTHFTISSADDAPERDPRVWRIEGSNDGTTWTTIFSQNNPAASIWTDRLQVVRLDHIVDYDEQTEAYSKFRMVTDATGLAAGPAAFFQIGEIELFEEGFLTPPEKGVVIGVGTESLLGDDLTDIGNDGVEDLYFPPDDLGGFDAIFFSSDESAFGVGEAAFNVFDNIVGPGDDKWCCGTVFPQIVGADFLGIEYRLTHFTVSSANDTPERDPRVWRIEGSSDGETWTTIFSQDNPAFALWSDRLQVIRFEEGVDYEVQTQAYSMFRMVTDATGLPAGPAAFFQVGEIELFGTEGDATDQVFRRGDADQNGAVQLTDAVQVLSFLFLGVPTRVPDCLDAADGDDNGVVQLTDAIRILGFLFLGGPAPPAPGVTTCGPDPTEDPLGCTLYDC